MGGIHSLTTFSLKFSSGSFLLVFSPVVIYIRLQSVTFCRNIPFSVKTFILFAVFFFFIFKASWFVVDIIFSPKALNLIKVWWAFPYFRVNPDWPESIMGALLACQWWVQLLAYVNINMHKLNLSENRKEGWECQCLCKSMNCRATHALYLPWAWCYSPFSWRGGVLQRLYE